MKTLTLDETIEWMNKCLFEGTDYEDEFWSNYTDALHYLKTYRENQQTYIENSRKAEKARELYLDSAEELDALRDYWAEQQANPPLTWDELSEMEGKPVWVEDNIDEPENITKYWAICRRIEKAQETEYALLSEFYYDKAQYGKIWQAYRKERE